MTYKEVLDSYDTKNIWVLFNVYGASMPRMIRNPWEDTSYNIYKDYPVMCHALMEFVYDVELNNMCTVIKVTIKNKKEEVIQNG